MLLEFNILLAIGLTSGVLYYYFQRLLKKQKENYNKKLIEVEKAGKEKAARSLIRSKEVLTGLAAEQIAPHLKNFPYYPGDVRSLGSPIDGVIFPGSVKDDIEKIVFLEIKTGNSRLSKKQKQIKELIKNGKVEWLEFRIPTKRIKLEHEEDLVKIDECFCLDCIVK